MSEDEWESFNGGHDWIRTNDHYHVKVVLYQLSYATEAKIKTKLYTIHHLVLLKNNNLSTKIPIPTSIIISAKLNTAGKSTT